MIALLGLSTPLLAYLFLAVFFAGWIFLGVWLSRRERGDYGDQ